MRTIPATIMATGILLITIAGAQAFAQNPPGNDSDVEVPAAPIPMTCRSQSNDSQVITDDAEFKKLLAKVDREYCSDARNLKIDFQKYSLIAVQIDADCRANVSLRVTKNAETKSYNVTVSEKYGGCRGTDLHNRWVLVEKLPAGYTVQFKIVSDRNRSEQQRQGKEKSGVLSLF